MELKQETILEIGKFCILWAEFEKEHCNNDCNSNLIWQFAQTHKTDIPILQNLSQELNGRVDLYEDNIVHYVDYNLTPQGARKPSVGDLKTIKDFIAFKGENLLAGALLSIYRIRNNLLHGLKNVNELDGQIELFKAINAVLGEILGKLKLKKEN